MTTKARLTWTGRWALRCLPVLAAVELASGCGVQPPFQDLPGGGVDAHAGQVTIDDIWVDGPRGIAAGSSAPLRLTIANESATAPDSLVSVSTPVAARVQLEDNGHPVKAITVPADGAVDLERTTGVELEGFRQALTPGQWFPVTLTFAKAAPVTVQAAAGPLAAPEPRYAAPAALASDTVPLVRTVGPSA